MSKQELKRLVYRSILRWARSRQDVPFLIKDKHVAEVFPQFSAVQLGLQGSPAIKSIAETSFRDNLDMQEDDAVEALDAAFVGLRLLNSHYANEVRHMREQRDLHSNRDGIRYPIGQVFMHRRLGYIAVISRWDRICARDHERADKKMVSRDQPFYWVLPDEDDCQRLYRSVHFNGYVAEEDIMPLEVPRRVRHRLLEDFFKGYSATHKRYYPNEQIRFQYPDDYDFPDIVPCREDTNLLYSPTEERREGEHYRPVNRSHVV